MTAEGSGLAPVADRFPGEVGQFSPRLKCDLHSRDVAPGRANFAREASWWKVCLSRCKYYFGPALTLQDASVTFQMQSTLLVRRSVVTGRAVQQICNSLMLHKPKLKRKLGQNLCDLAQLVQSACLTSRRSTVQIRYRPFFCARELRKIAGS